MQIFSLFPIYHSDVFTSHLHKKMTFFLNMGRRRSNMSDSAGSCSSLILAHTGHMLSKDVFFKTRRTNKPPGMTFDILAERGVTAQSKYVFILLA